MGFSACARQAFLRTKSPRSRIESQAVARQKAGDLSRIVMYYQQAIALQADLWEAHYNLEMVLQEQGELEDAIASHHKALELQPDLVDAY